MKWKKSIEKLIKEGATLIDTCHGVQFYEIGNHKYMVRNDKIIYRYYFDDTKLRSDNKK